MSSMLRNIFLARKFLAHLHTLPSDMCMLIRYKVSKSMFMKHWSESCPHI